MRKDYFNYIYEGFKQYFGCSDEEVAEWWPVGTNAIVVILTDGRRMEYHHSAKTFRQTPVFRNTEDDWRREFARCLYFEMTDRGFNQVYLSEESGISQTAISRYLRREATPSAYAVDKLARALGCYRDDLLPPFELDE